MSDRRTVFEALVLSGIWLLVLIAFGKRPISQAVNFRINALGYMDEHGRPGDGPKEYRRETAFPELKL